MTARDWNLEAAITRVTLLDKARAAVTHRRHTDRPGGDWHLSSDLPMYYGSHGRSMITVTEDGTRYKVEVFDASGTSILLTRTYKGLDTAFRNGRKLANGHHVATR